MRIVNSIIKFTVLAVIILILAVLGYALFGDRDITKTSPLVGKQSPGFTIKLYDGKRISSEELKGKTVLLNFWASWCIPCRQEAPALDEAWEKYKDRDVVFIGVNVWDDNENAMSYMEKFGGQYPNGIDPEEEIQVNFGIGGVPETYFIDKTGKIRDKYNGPLTGEIIDYYLDRAMNPGEEETS